MQAASIEKTERAFDPPEPVQQILRSGRGYAGERTPRRYSLRERTSLTGCFALRSRFVLSAVVVPLCGVIIVPRSSARRARRVIHEGRAARRKEGKQRQRAASDGANQPEGGRGCREKNIDSS